jgi:hypothetical protein
MAGSFYVNAFNQYFDTNGNPLSAGKIYFYEAGTLNPLSVYADQGLVTPLSNPVVLDGDGRAPTIWMQGEDYKVILTDLNDVMIQTVDNYNLGNAATFDSIKQYATTSYSGVVELATIAEAIAGTDSTRAVTPDGLVASIQNFAQTTALTTLPDGYIKGLIPSVSNSYRQLGVSGTPSYTSGVYQLVGTDYLFISKSGIGFFESKPWTIQTKVNFINAGTQKDLISSSLAGGTGIFLGRTAANKLSLSLGNSGWNIANGTLGSATINAIGSNYWFRIDFDGAQYTVGYSLDGINYTTDITVVSSVLVIDHPTIYFGRYSSNSDFSQDMTGTQISIDGTVVYNQWSINEAQTLYISGGKCRSGDNSYNMFPIATNKRINAVWASGAGNGGRVSGATFPRLTTIAGQTFQTSGTTITGAFTNFGKKNSLCVNQTVFYNGEYRKLVSFTTPTAGVLDSAFTSPAPALTPLVTADFSVYCFSQYNPTLNTYDVCFDNNESGTNIPLDANVVAAGFTKYRRVASCLIRDDGSILVFLAYDRSGGGICVETESLLSASLVGTSRTSYCLDAPTLVKALPLFYIEVGSNSGTDVSVYFYKEEIRTNVMRFGKVDYFGSSDQASTKFSDYVVSENVLEASISGATTVRNLFVSGWIDNRD